MCRYLDRHLPDATQRWPSRFVSVASPKKKPKPVAPKPAKPAEG